ncbi:hypothetical protein [Pseudoxanthomonas koreensis]|uniref:hypothetical protein n=1 Tax=Pseudoxanthomonas koreensis TaxID=266061 RepID=UPI0013917154|nr:hypothetical protein [Pseudoxanthomonas koreensis]KAF1697712.1 hypothetical protein CSC64_00435 [Pseudoxanthomonas koreensis]
MTRAAEIVQALIARAPPRTPVERSTGMPYGWALWLRAQPQPQAHPHASPGALVEVVAQRPPAPVPRGEELATWPAFFSLFRQGWLPPPADELPLRVGPRVGSVVLHLLFVAFLAWVAWMQSLARPPLPEAGGGGERIEVGFIGAGDPGTPRAAEEGPPSDAPAGEPAPPAAPAPPAQADVEGASAAMPEVPPLPQVEPAPAAPQLPAPALPEVAVREVPEPVQEPQPPAEQPVQVTEVEQPTIDYVLPPTTPRELQPVRTPVEPQLREREVAVVQAPVVAAPQARPVDVPLRQPREVELRTREVDEPLPQVEVRPVAVQAPQVVPRLPGAPETSVRQREVAMPSPPSPEPPGAATATQPSTTAGVAPSPTPATGQAGAASAAAGSTAGAAPTATPGVAPGASATRPGTGSGWESPRTGDDWGQAASGDRRPGGASGLFDEEGRVRLPGDGSGTGPGAGPGTRSGDPGEGVAGRGAPGGDNDDWTRARLAESGTWLKRPPYDYEPTSLDRYWVPNESLLADWVRKGIKSVAIPIPGTSKKIDCVISLLQLGGGCGISDPNLNEQPTDGRPPPDVPFKPELQEDNGSVRP